MMHQKFSDELMEQNAANEEVNASQSRSFDKMALTGRNVSILGEEEQKSVPPVKKQGQGAGASHSSEGRNSITEGDELEMDLTPAAEAADEAKMMEQMRATNQVAEQLMQQEA